MPPCSRCGLSHGFLFGAEWADGVGGEGDLASLTVAASTTPSTDPAANQPTIARSTCSRNAQTRSALEPVWMTPCSGSTIAGGRICTITVITAMPPPMPNPAVRAEAKNDSTSSAPTCGRVSVAGISASNEWANKGCPGWVKADGVTSGRHSLGKTGAVLRD